MKLLLDHHEPFSLARGGYQIQIEETSRALREIGVDVEYLRWWDSDQKGDVLHFFGIPPLHTVERAQGKGIKVVVTHLLTNTCNRSPAKLAAQALVTRSLLAFPPARGLCAKMGWLSLRRADAVVVGLEAEARVMLSVWGVERVHVIPLALRKEFQNLQNPQLDHSFDSRSPERVPPAGQSSGLSARFVPTATCSTFRSPTSDSRILNSDFRLPPSSLPLLSVGTICARKRSVELAEIARAAKIPILFVGNPLSESDPCWKSFVSQCDGTFVRHMSHVEDVSKLIRIFREARGFVHFSDGENWCFAAHEAAACGLPLLLPDQPWSRELFGTNATYWKNDRQPEQLRQFYDDCPSMHVSPHTSLSWTDIARKLLKIYSESPARNG